MAGAMAGSASYHPAMTASDALRTLAAVDCLSDGHHSLPAEGPTSQPGPAPVCTNGHHNAPHHAANRGTENDRLFHQSYSPGRFGAGVCRLVLRAVVKLKLCLQPRGAADVYRRRVPPLQLGDSEHPADHRLHDEAARQSEQRLPRGDGPRSQGSPEARRSIIPVLRGSSEHVRGIAGRRCPAMMVPKYYVLLPATVATGNTSLAA